jgi:uncharacterized protein (DUF433 family)
MTTISNEQTAIIRTERGLTIAGTRITIYDIMDYVTAQYPPKFIRGLFDLTEEQINAALAYIEANRADVEAEYQMVLKEAEELRLYYEEKIAISLPELPPNHRNLVKKLFEQNFKQPRPSLSLSHEFFSRS